MSILLLLTATVAILVHRRVAWYPLACAAATLCTTLPALLALEASGAARTDFMPFSLAVMLAWCLVVSALAGLPFFLWRWHRGISMAKLTLPTGIPWSMLGGMLCGSAITLLPVLLARAQFSGLVEGLLVACLILGILGTILAMFGGTLFLAAMTMAGGTPDPARKAQFRTGARLAAGIGVCLVLATWAAPEEWSNPSANRLLALYLNIALLLPALAGWIAGSRQQGRDMGDRRRPAPEVVKWLTDRK